MLSILYVRFVSTKFLDTIRFRMRTFKRLRKACLTGFFCFISSSLIASVDPETRIADLENKMSQVATINANHTYGANTASARPNLECGRLYFSMDALYWNARVGGTDFAYTDNDPYGRTPIRGRTKHVDFDWDWGLRVGLGYKFKHDAWDIKAEYTWWETRGSKSVSAGLTSSVVPMKGNPNLLATQVSAVENVSYTLCTLAKSRINLDFHSIELNLGRDYYISSKVSLRPNWGIKTAWIDLIQDTSYTGGTPLETQNGLKGNTIRVKQCSDYWGMGPRAGLDTRWYMGNKISGIVNLSCAAVYGFFDVSQKETFSAIEQNQISLTANRHAFSPAIQGQFGLQYATYLMDHRHHIAISLLYDAQYWWRQNQTLKFQGQSNGQTPLKYLRTSEDLAISGISINGRWDF